MQGVARLPLRTLALAVALAGSAMCTSGNIIEPFNQLQVSNVANDFQLQVNSLANVTQTLSYNWINTGDSAYVNKSSSVIDGTATLTVRGPTGTVLHQSALQNNGMFYSMKGTVGTWQIIVDLEKADGNIAFRVLKAP